MKSLDKELYEAPFSMVVEVVQEGVICASGNSGSEPTYEGFGSELTW
jgi:hypothetical protein